MGRSLGFGSTSTYLTALFRLGFPTAPSLQLNLARKRNSPVHSTKGTLSPINGLELLVSTRFQVLFHSPSGVLFTFPSRYSSTIGHQGYSALTSGLATFTRDSTSPVLLGTLSTHTQHFQLRDSHPLRSTIPSQFAYHHALRR